MLSRFFFTTVLVVAPYTVFANAKVAACAEGQWGTIVGQFIYDGQVPDAATIKVTKDAKRFGDAILDESLLVDKETAGVANVFFFLKTREPTASILVHPSYESTANLEVEWQVGEGRFAPHVLAIRTSQTLVVRSQVGVSYNPVIQGFRNRESSREIPRENVENVLIRRFKFPEPRPIQAASAVYPWMSGWLHVSNHPYVGISEKNGRFTISNCPVGEFEFVVWHERCGFVKQLNLRGELRQLKMGCLHVHVLPGMNDLGIISVPPGQFARAGSEKSRE